jgi:hypothetical protein
MTTSFYNLNPCMISFILLSYDLCDILFFLLKIKSTFQFNIEIALILTAAAAAK